MSKAKRIHLHEVVVVWVRRNHGSDGGGMGAIWKPLSLFFLALFFPPRSSEGKG